MGDFRRFLLLFVGICLFFGGIMVGFGALEYEVKQVGTADIAPMTVKGFVTYEDLEGREKEIVDRALAGEAVHLREAGELPGKRARRGKLGVDKGDTYYILTRRMFFNWRTTYGRASISMVLAGLLSIWEAIRREQFPDRPIYWVRI